MNAVALKNTIITMLKNGLPVMLKGAPGVGKTDIVYQVKEELKWDLIITHPVVSDPTDFKGLPGIVNGEAEFLPFGDLRRLIEAKKHTICFIDDIGQAPAVVQAAAMQLILARRVNGHVVSDKVVFIAATNRREDRAGVTGILEPVKSRFASILEFTVSVDDWVEWAMANDVPVELVAFIRFRPALLHTKGATADIVNHPCPRTITYAGKLLKVGLRDVETLAGAIGEGAASELVGFLKLYEQLPDIDALLLDPKNTSVPVDPASLYAVTMALVHKATKDNLKRIMSYVKRMPTEFQVLFVKDAVRKDKSIQNTQAFIEWAVANKNVLL